MKRMWKALAVWGCCLTIATAVVAPAWAADADADKDVLSAIPADAWASLTIRNLAELDRKILTLNQQLNSPMQMSMLQMAKGMLGFVSGVDDNGSLVLVAMPNPAIMAGQPDQSLALLIPCTDFGSLTSMMQPEDAGEGVTKLLFKGQVTYAAPYGSYAVMAPNVDTVKKIVAAKGGKGLRGNWSQHQIDHFKNDDISLWVNLEGVLADPSISGMLGGLMAMSGQGPEAMEDLKSWKGFGVSVRLDDNGIGLGLFGNTIAGSKQAKSMAAVAKAEDSLLRGLPGGEYVLAGGLIASKESGRISAEELKKKFQNPMTMAKLGPEGAQKLSQILASFVEDLRMLSFSVSTTPDAADGVFSVAEVLTFEKGAKQKISHVAELLKLVTGGVIPMDPQTAEQIASLVQFTEGAENVAGVSVDHISVQLDKVEDMSADDRDAAMKIVGKDGVLIRLAAVDDKHLVVTFGGGTERLEKVLNLAKNAASPLADDAGIKKAAAVMPKSRFAEIYVDVEQGAKFISTIQKLVGEPVTAKMGSIDTPAAIVIHTVHDTGLQAEILLPTPMIKAVAEAVMANAMGGGPAAPGAGTPPQAQPQPNAGERAE